MQITAILSLVGSLSLGIAMIVLARLSKRLGHVTQAKQYHIWLYVATILVWLGAIVHAFLLGRGIDGSPQLQQEIVWVLLIRGLPALGVTIALIVAWYYWSWLLAERD